MKKLLMFFAMSLGIFGCGSKESCIEQCNNSFLKNHNKCELDYANDLNDSFECIKKEHAEMSKCNGKCYGNL